jgi:Tfp pilus assembly protein PilF
MGERQTVGLDGSRCALLVPWVLFALTLVPVLQASAQETVASCAPSIGRITALQGNVEIQRAGQKYWAAVKKLDTALCADDRLRTDAQSRALVSLLPETIVRVDQNTVIRLKQSDEAIEVEFFGAELAESLQNAQPRGAGYFITRFPRKFKVTTPHMNAAVEGTEFMVQITPDATRLTVLEGKVSSQSVATGSTQLVAAGQSIASGAAGPGTIETVVKPQDAVQWVLRYPPISDQSDTSGISRAEQLLRAGSVEEALAAIDAALIENPSSSDAHALRSVIQVAKNNKSGALESANKAIGFGADNYRAWLAMSYAQQAGFELDAALESAQKAEALRERSALSHARVAELLLSLGDTRRAEEAARSAVTAGADESYAHSILGFVHLAQIDTTSARVDFTAAIERDSFSALPRLGLGLARIRDGELMLGREELEIAVALDPSNSLLRSYVGKAYYEENTQPRDSLAATQYELASSLDPKDPTPYFYDAILKQSQNRPVAALDALTSAVSANDNRAVYRSRLLIDDDAAAQGATVAVVYGDVGFERLAINQSTEALSENPGNSSAHRELAAAYSNIPRHDIARVSEALQAQIRQPVSIVPVPPMLGTDSVLVLKDVGPTQLGSQEFNQLYNGNDFEIMAEALAGSRDSLGGQLVLNGLADRIAYSVSAMDYESDGFVENDAATKSVYDLFIQGQLQPGSTIQLDAKRSEIEVGQTFAEFDPIYTEPDIISEKGDAFRLSGHHNSTPRVDLIWTAVYENRDREILSFPDRAFVTGNDSATYAIEMQNLLRIGAWQLVSGLGYVDQQDKFAEQIDLSTTTANAYAYGQWKSPTGDLGLQVGFSADWFRLKYSFFDEPIDKDQFNPRLGVIWTPRPSTTIRAAWASSLKRPFVRSQTIEPTQVAGFNQYFTGFERFFGDPNGTISERLGLAVDQAISDHTKLGVEVSRRDLQVPELIQSDVNWDERSALAYWYRSFPAGSWEGTISLDAEYEEIERPALDTGPEGILTLETTRVPLALRLFSARGITLRGAATYVRQHGRFTVAPGEQIFPKDDEAIIGEISMEYLLPRRKGSILVGVNNAFDEFVDLLEIDPLNPRVATRQLAFARIRFDF